MTGRIDEELLGLVGSVVLVVATRARGRGATTLDLEEADWDRRRRSAFRASFHEIRAQSCDMVEHSAAAAAAAPTVLPQEPE